MKGIKFGIRKPLDSALRGLNLNVIQTNGFGSFSFDIGPQVLDITKGLSSDYFCRGVVENHPLAGRKLWRARH
jgi:hypothetical protein